MKKYMPKNNNANIIDFYLFMFEQTIKHHNASQ